MESVSSPWAFAQGRLRKSRQNLPVAWWCNRRSAENPAACNQSGRCGELTGMGKLILAAACLACAALFASCNGTDLAAPSGLPASRQEQMSSGCGGPSDLGNATTVAIVACPGAARYRATLVAS